MTAPRISAKSNENMDAITSQAFANISGNFRKISGNIKFPESLQPSYVCIPSHRTRRFRPRIIYTQPFTVSRCCSGPSSRHDGGAAVVRRLSPGQRPQSITSRVPAGFLLPCQCLSAGVPYVSWTKLIQLGTFSQLLQAASTVRFVVVLSGAAPGIFQSINQFIGQLITFTK